MVTPTSRHGFAPGRERVEVKKDSTIIYLYFMSSFSEAEIKAIRAFNFPFRSSMFCPYSIGALPNSISVSKVCQPGVP